jgi:co-chaperonin GroES (HSP10)
MKLKDGRNLVPLTGHAFIRPEQLFKNTGPIVIPDKYQKAPHVVGRVVEVALTPEQAKYSEDIPIVAGSRVIVSHASGRYIPGTVTDDVMDFALEYQCPGSKDMHYSILAILDDDVDLKPQTQEIERCKFCGNAKPAVAQGMIMMSGQCPRCLKDRYGVTRPAIPEVKVSDAEVEEFHEIIRGRG